MLVSNGADISDKKAIAVILFDGFELLDVLAGGAVAVCASIPRLGVP